MPGPDEFRSPSPVEIPQAYPFVDDPLIPPPYNIHDAFYRDQCRHVDAPRAPKKGQGEGISPESLNNWRIEHPEYENYFPPQTICCNPD